MNTPEQTRHYRLLIVDDNRAIHDDFKKILAPDLELKQLDEIEADLFGKTIEISSRHDFDIDSAYQGEEGLAKVRQSLDENRPYSLAFIDMRMPPGWNGIETIEHVWEIDPLLQIVICSAYSDHSWSEISMRLGNNDRLLILKKPFDNIEILQMAYAMSRKCELARQLQTRRQQQDTEYSIKAGNIHQLDSIRETIGGELRGPVEEIKDSVNLLQHSFSELAEQLGKLRNLITQQTDLMSEQMIQDLLGSIDWPELEKRIPSAFRRVHSALQKVSNQTETGETSGNSMH